MSIFYREAKWLLVFFAILFNTNANATDWQVIIDSINTFASPRFADLNNDGIKDIIIGGGRENGNPNKILALNGNNGQVIWQTGTKNENYTSAKFIDINHDNTDDIIIGGRLANLVALNGKTGAIIWQFYNDTIHPLLKGWYNFYEPQIIKDVNSDGVKDILICNGGNPTYSASDTIRPPAGYIMILNSVTGSIISFDSMPDKKETYMPPIVYDLNSDGDEEIIVGTGGETIRGSLWLTHLSDLLQNNISNSIILHTDSVKGFIQPPVLADINTDHILDIIAPVFNGGLVAINGNDFHKIWSIYLPGYEIYSAPSVGNFNDDSIPDFYLTLSKGVYPSYNSFLEIIVDGLTGNIKRIDSVGYLFQLSSAIIYDKNEDGIDEIAQSFNYLSDDGNIKNYLKEYDVKNEITNTIIDTLFGINFSSTPLLSDLNNDGLAEMIYSYNINGFSSTNIICKTTNINSENISWSSYLGNNKNGIYDRTKYLLNIQNHINNYSNCTIAYPSPFTNYLNIVTENHTEISLYNTKSVKLVDFSLNNINNPINLSYLANNMYILIDNRNKCIQKIVKQ